ncbi:hypothetical protein ONZ45_g7721 [Pleurotus djamor]|nr:hypothetical protein ONZ45_g7721 [Pleurotus djamor]
MSSPNDQCPSYETRSAVQIAWSCIAIIFACTWTAVHPNVPPASVSTSQWRMAWRRIKMMLWTILLPDLMMVEASIQRARARRISEVANRKVAGPPSEQSDTTSCVGAQSPLEPVLQDTEASNHNPPSALFETTPPAVPIHQWTRTHSYFLVMGGFAVANEDKPGSWTTVSVSDVLDGRIPWPSVKEGDILNGSKGDAFSKTLVILQATWFFVQLYARIFYNLRITELEWVTLWYAYFCASLYVAWFKKPYDVHQPIVLPDRNAELPKVNRPHSSQISNFLSGGHR